MYVSEMHANTHIVYLERDLYTLSCKRLNTNTHTHIYIYTNTHTHTHIDTPT